MSLQKKYRQNVSSLKFTSIEDTAEMTQAKQSNKLANDVSLSLVTHRINITKSTKMMDSWEYLVPAFAFSKTTLFVIQ